MHLLLRNKYWASLQHSTSNYEKYNISLVLQKLYKTNNFKASFVKLLSRCHRQKPGKVLLSIFFTSEVIKRDTFSIFTPLQEGYFNHNLWKEYRQFLVYMFHSNFFFHNNKFLFIPSLYLHRNRRWRYKSLFLSHHSCIYFNFHMLFICFTIYLCYTVNSSRKHILKGKCAYYILQ